MLAVYFSFSFPAGRSLIPAYAEELTLVKYVIIIIIKKQIMNTLIDELRNGNCSLKVFK